MEDLDNGIYGCQWLVVHALVTVNVKLGLGGRCSSRIS